MAVFPFIAEYQEHEPHHSRFGALLRWFHSHFLDRTTIFDRERCFSLSICCAPIPTSGRCHRCLPYNRSWHIQVETKEVGRLESRRSTLGCIRPISAMSEFMDSPQSNVVSHQRFAHQVRIRTTSDKLFAIGEAFGAILELGDELITPTRDLGGVFLLGGKVGALLRIRG